MRLMSVISSVAGISFYFFANGIHYCGRREATKEPANRSGQWARIGLMLHSVLVRG